MPGARVASSSRATRLGVAAAAVAVVAVAEIVPDVLLLLARSASHLVASGREHRLGVVRRGEWGVDPAVPSRDLPPTPASEHLGHRGVDLDVSSPQFTGAKGVAACATPGPLAHGSQVVGKTSTTLNRTRLGTLGCPE